MEDEDDDDPVEPDPDWLHDEMMEAQIAESN
jgi:hypothetical protein